ncbi:hypothetical protein ACVC7V_21325 [Hydrogenophaga sp. A37]|uniref:hypothetical protein n=1 Tax=Hydrogenophaga sp. A37 TaxID=1945864 RepID=UPI0009878A08|nr:hypothetical protein [Hydrogenophaga sp. A37]OOG81542.1 hypothetical protein B0E41_17430 [Hydrogenophaga sp. A37]
MSGGQYTPRDETLPARVVTFFSRCPDEELNDQDIAKKWHVDPKNVKLQLQLAVEAGLLKIDGRVYSAGPNIGRVSPSPAAVATVNMPSQRKTHVRTTIDIEAIAFEDAPAGLDSPKKAHDRWVDKMRTMPEGKSFAVPLEYRHALRAAVTALHKEGWKLSVVNEGATVRVVCKVSPVPAAREVVS